MIYYIFLALIDIGLYLYNHWTELTFTVASTAIGIIVGRRIGTRLAYGYALRLLGINHKSTLERKVEWLIKQEEARGNIWNVERKGLKKTTIGHSFLSRWVTIFPVLFVASFIHRLEIKKSILSRRKRRMNFLKSNLSKKLSAVIVATVLISLNEKFQLHLSQETIDVIAGIVAVYVAGQSVVDSKKAQAVPIDDSSADQSN